tara:strand:- start:59 stop:670 length:612 start_codon:yes stop_codon:yes gene_type:complete
MVGRLVDRKNKIHIGDKNMNNINKNFNNNYSTRKSSYWKCELSPFHTKKITAKHPVKEDVYKEGVLLYSKGQTPDSLYMFDYGTFLAHEPNLEKWNILPFVKTSQVFTEVEILAQRRKVETLEWESKNPSLSQYDKEDLIAEMKDEKNILHAMRAKNQGLLPLAKTVEEKIAQVSQQEDTIVNESDLLTDKKAGIKRSEVKRK